MATVEISAGGIVYRPGEKEHLILMIADRQRRWSFPKGIVHQGETPPVAARREIQEETGIRGEVLDLLGESRYFYRRNGLLIDKTVYFYLARALSTAITPQLSEIADARWFAATEALRVSTFPANTRLLHKALALLTEDPPPAET